MALANHRFGIDWKSGLMNGFIHDGWVDRVGHARGFRDVSVSVIPPWHWDMTKMPVPAGVSYEDLNSMRLHFRFKDVADFRIGLDLDTIEVESESEAAASTRSQLQDAWVSQQAIYLRSEIDEDDRAVAAAQGLHGGEFHTVRMHLVGGRWISVVFRDCACEPSSWTSFEAWSAYPLQSGFEVPALRSTPLSTANRYIREHRRHLCTTRITQTSAISSEVDVLYLCEDCIDDWIEDYAPGSDIPRTATGAGVLPMLHSDTQQWERGRFPNQRCQCMVDRRID